MTTTAASTVDAFVSFLLAELRCAAIRARAFATEIDSIDVALRGGFIDVENAIIWAADIGFDVTALSSTTIAST